MDYRVKKLAKNSIILGIGSVIPAVCSLLLLPLYTAALSKEEYGVYDIVATLPGLIVPIFSLQLTMALFRLLVDVRGSLEKSKKYISTAFFIIVLIPIIPAVIVAFFLNYSTFFNRSMIVIYLYLTIIQELLNQIARGFGQFKIFILSACINFISNAIFAILFLKVGEYRLNGVFLSLNLSLLIACIAIFIRLGMWKYLSLKCISKGNLKEMLQFSFPLIPNGIVVWINQLSDRLMILFYCGPEENGVYGVANKLPVYLSHVFGIFNKAWVENASEFSEDKDSIEYYGKTSQQLENVMVAAAALMIGLMPAIFRILIDDSYEEAYFHIPILVIATVYGVLSQNCGSILIALKNTKSIGWTSAVGAMLNVLINLIFMPRLGILAATFSALLSNMTIFYIREIILYRKVKMKINVKRHLFSLLLMISMVFLYEWKILWIDIVNFIFSVAVAVVLNLALLKKILKKLH